MAFLESDAHRNMPIYLHNDDWSEDLMMPHWQGHTLTFERPIERYHYGTDDIDLAKGQHWIQELNSTHSSCHLTYDATYSSYRSPDEQMHRPYYNALSPICNSSSASSDRLSPSFRSQALSLVHSSESCHTEVVEPELDLTSCGDVFYTDAFCVAMQNVQKTADALNEDLFNGFGNYEVYEPQELVSAAPGGYEPPPSTCRQLPSPIPSMRQQDPSSLSPATLPDPNLDPESEYEPPTPTVRRRLPQKARPTTTRTRNRIAKRPSTHHRTSASPKETNRPFLCPLAAYNCPATFTAKNEWKRHASTQHFRLGFWRCDQCTSRTNDFNRKDLFVQHVRRMHSMTSTTNSKKKSREDALDGIVERCYRRTVELPERCRCVFCGEGFEGEGALEGWMEHVGRHMEGRRMGSEDAVVGEWREDKGLEAWLLRHGKIVDRKGVLVVAK